MCPCVLTESSRTRACDGRIVGGTAVWCVTSTHCARVSSHIRIAPIDAIMVLVYVFLCECVRASHMHSGYCQRSRKHRTAHRICMKLRCQHDGRVHYRTAPPEPSSSSSSGQRGSASRSFVFIDFLDAKQRPSRVRCKSAATYIVDVHLYRISFSRSCCNI